MRPFQSRARHLPRLGRGIVAVENSCSDACVRESNAGDDSGGRSIHFVSEVPCPFAQRVSQLIRMLQPFAGRIETYFVLREPQRDQGRGATDTERRAEACPQHTRGPTVYKT